MRLDLFLKTSRLVKRRTLAHEFCERGWIEVNGTRGKPGKDVSPGDRIILHLGMRRKEIEVLAIPRGALPVKDAHTVYRVVSDLPEMERG